MLANQPYEPISIMRFEQSLLSLGAALRIINKDQSAADASKETSENALLEVQRLRTHLQGKL
jgi:hypothetical protein